MPCRPNLFLAVGLALVSAASLAWAAPGPLPASPPMKVELIADSDFSTTKDKYVAKAQESLDDWKRKMDAAAQSTGDAAKATGDAAGAQLNDAWRRTQIEAKKLQAATADGWDRARGGFEKASHDLSQAWSRAHPDSK